MSKHTFFSNEESRCQPLWQDLQGRHLFVAGGTGFFGRWILTFLSEGLRRGFQFNVSVLSRDPQSFLAGAFDGQWRRFNWVKGQLADFDLNGTKIDYMLHGAESADRQDHHSVSILEQSLRGTQNFLMQAEKSGCSSIHYLSSGAVYGAQRDVLQKEDGPFSEEADFYAQGKKLSEEAFLSWGGRHNARVSISRSFAFVGPYLPLDRQYAAGNFVGACLRGGEIHIKGDGTALRSYMYPTELVIWLLTMLLRAKSGSIFNVGSDQAVSILELAQRCRQVALERGKAPREIVVQQKPIAGAEPSRYVPSIEKARGELGVQVEIDLTQALRRTFDFYAHAEGTI